MIIFLPINYNYYLCLLLYLHIVCLSMIYSGLWPLSFLPASCTPTMWLLCGLPLAKKQYSGKIQRENGSSRAKILPSQSTNFPFTALLTAETGTSICSAASLMLPGVNVSSPVSKWRKAIFFRRSENLRNGYVQTFCNAGKMTSGQMIQIGVDNGQRNGIASQAMITTLQLHQTDLPSRTRSSAWEVCVST